MLQDGQPVVQGRGNFGDTDDTDDSAHGRSLLQ
jgi:hypothetical protein